MADVAHLSSTVRPAFNRSRHRDADGTTPPCGNRIRRTARCLMRDQSKNAEVMRTPRDTEEAVRARVKRQEALYEPGKRFDILIWEGVLHALVCPHDVMAAQLDRLVGLIGMSSVSFGVIPLGAPSSSRPSTVSGSSTTSA
ncbi:Scr1 family TA system antitoxin-like transcriptional regulator [Streptomyces antimycoticus]|uniref:Scr1 family TA system antitoxin-like transcriptional regulator n=1 Tax=Streptomyces antimycoticus TaxID=68175 RepID=UPI0037CEEACB